MTSSQENVVQNKAAGPFYDSLPAKNVEPLWLKFEAMVPPRPNPSAQSSIWRYEDIKPLLLDAGRIVPIEEAERRVLMLINPSMQAPCTTDTIYAGLQLIQPGETAPAHRHVAFALRMVIEGNGGYTAVDGEKIIMERGDVILTPSWTWHDHGNEGTEPVIWLDGLDLPIFKLFKVNFAEPYTKPQYPSEVSSTSLSKYPWKPVAKALNESGGPYAIYQYHSRSGGHLSKTLSAQAERISAGSTSPHTRETTSFVYHIMEGRGYSMIQESENKEPRRIDCYSIRDLGFEVLDDAAGAAHQQDTACGDKTIQAEHGFAIQTIIVFIDDKIGSATAIYSLLGGMDLTLELWRGPQVDGRSADESILQ